MAITMQPSSPVAPWPLVLGGGRPLTRAARIDTFCPPPPAPVLAGGRGVEALRLAIRAGHPALYTVGVWLAERGRFPLRQAGLPRALLQDDRLGSSRAALVAAHRNHVCGALALHARAVSALSPPGLHQDTTTLSLEGAYEAEPRRGA